jgi:aspartate racemase
MRQVKTIGLIGGLSWESSALYYRLLNRGAHAALGGHHNARSVLYTVDLAEVLADAEAGRWDAVADTLIAAGKALARAGADFVLITANTAHAVAAQVGDAIGLPLLHIADPTGQAIRQQGLERVGLIGTRPTMESGFYAQRLKSSFGVEVALPSPEERADLHQVIVGELTLGRIEPAAKARCLEIVHRLQAAGAQGVVMGCTELPLLIEQRDTPVPLFDTARLHVDAALRLALAGEPS